MGNVSLLGGWWQERRQGKTDLLGERDSWGHHWFGCLGMDLHKYRIHNQVHVYPGLTRSLYGTQSTLEYGEYGYFWRETSNSIHLMRDWHLYRDR